MEKCVKAEDFLFRLPLRAILIGWYWRLAIYHVITPKYLCLCSANSQIFLLGPQEFPNISALGPQIIKIFLFELKMSLLANKYLCWSPNNPQISLQGLNQLPNIIEPGSQTYKISLHAPKYLCCSPNNSQICLLEPDQLTNTLL